jgi:hypothetical protein
MAIEQISRPQTSEFTGISVRRDLMARRRSPAVNSIRLIFAAERSQS